MKSYCPILPKNLDDSVLEEAFPWQANPACQDWVSLESKAGEQVVIDKNWQELINSAGQPVYYYIYDFDSADAEKLFGEDRLAQYLEPFEIKIYLEIKDVPKMLSQYGGFFSDDTVTGYLHIKTFKRLALADIEPKPQDVIQIISFGCDRPGDRGANYYEITNKEDQLINDKMNAAYGHYVWKITAKRYIFAQEGGAIPQFGEDGNSQTYDNKVEGITTNTEADKAYDYNIDEESRKEIFDQSINSQDSIYGGYYE